MKIKGAHTQFHQNVANLRLYIQSLNEQKKSLPRLQSRGGKTYGKFAQNIKRKKQKTKTLMVKLPKTRKFMQRTPRLQNPLKDCRRPPLSSKL